MRSKSESVHCTFGTNPVCRQRVVGHERHCLFGKPADLHDGFRPDACMADIHQLKQVMRYQIRELQCRTSATTEVRPRTYQTGCCSSPKPHLFEVVWKSLQNTFRAVLGPWLRQLLQHARNSSGVSSWFEVWREHYSVPISALTISVWCWLCLVATGQFQRVRPFPVSLNVQA